MILQFYNTLNTIKSSMICANSLWLYQRLDSTNVVGFELEMKESKFQLKKNDFSMN